MADGNGEGLVCGDVLGRVAASARRARQMISSNVRIAAVSPLT
jgi:hypothetical protein